jgi:hypothetical protein
MKKNLILTFLIGLINVCAFAQDKQPEFGIKFSGFVKSDFFYDSRQVTSIREGHFLLYPAAISKDSVGKDISAVPSMNFLSIQSRLSGKITGPDAFGAKTSGTIEADFFGNESAAFVDVNGFRLRHAFVKLNWTKTELLLGQYWHPFFNPSCYPSVISFNTGSPFQPFSRNPQARITYKMGNISLMAAVLAQRDFISPGGSALLRNSATPDANLQVSYGTKNDSANTELLIGAGMEYKTLKPRLSSTVGTGAAQKIYKIDESVSSMAYTFFFKWKIPAVTIKLQGVYGQNLYDLTMLGGFAVDTLADTTTLACKYTPYNTASFWLEAQTNGKKIQAGIFAGFTKNLGTSADIMASTVNSLTSATTTVRGYTIGQAYRIAPRIVFISGKLQLATEIEYTVASYATLNSSHKYEIDTKGVVKKSENAANVRVLFAAIYNF